MTFEHSSESNEHYTPPAVVEAARATLGGIDLDPASCAEANEVVRASSMFTQENSGLQWQWGAASCAAARVFLNPPGGMIGARSSPVVWWEKLCAEWEAGNVEQAVFICFNLEVLNTTQASPIACLDFPICYFKRRPKFWPPGTPPELRGKAGRPKYAGAAVYLPPLLTMVQSRVEVPRFLRAFSDLGKVVVPA